ncbi:MAG: arylsulfotransferase family protein [Planctomycetota bacterium]
MSVREKLSLLAFGLSAAVLLFLLGFAVSHFGWAGSETLRSAFSEVQTKVSDQWIDTHTHAARPGHQPGTRRLGNATPSPGVTLLTSFWAEDGGRVGARLIDSSGAVVGSYPIDPLAIWPTEPYQDMLTGTFHSDRSYIHGATLLPDGDLLFNMSWLGLVRMAPNGEVRWKSDDRTHHSVELNDEGNIWVCGVRMHAGPSSLAQFRGLTFPVIEDLAVLYSPEGERLREISMLDVLFQNNLDRLISQRTAPGAASDDVTHMNDVEELSAEMADQYPLFEAGDLLVSLRETHTVMVFDPDTLEVKWFDSAHQIRQHDPDFIGDGWISVYDNNPDGIWEGKLRMGSRLTALRPHTGEFRVIYPESKPGQLNPRPFYSEACGKAQQMADGHWIVLETTAGRVFELDANGTPIWEYCHEVRAEDGRVVNLMTGGRFPYDPDTVRGWFAN